MRIIDTRPELDDSDDEELDEDYELDEVSDLEAFAAGFDEDELEERIADYDPGELAYTYRLRPPPRHQNHSPLIILASVLGVALGLAIWVGVLTSVAGNVSGYFGDSVQTLAPQLSSVSVASVASCGTSPCETPRNASGRPVNRTSSCVDISGTSAVLSRAGVWFVTGCSGG